MESTMRTVMEQLEFSLRTDIERLERKFDSLEERANGHFRLLQWMLGFNLALSVAVLWVLICLLAYI
ncbi:MAG TPA: hypothetical protein DIW77_07450 [Chromatiaceae bacterium]|jgi:predicted glutamine amidotransferase|nr:MAG: hypothetical protein N838_11360 [Thiohalocapsa sp. PB-PSB1]HCS89889.1 hypothetical protein [Chromatiaceae bacterium]